MVYEIVHRFKAKQENFFHPRRDFHANKEEAHFECALCETGRAVTVCDIRKQH